MSPVQTRVANAGDAGVIASLLTHLGYPSESRDIPPRLRALDDSATVVLLASEGGRAPLGLVAVHVFPALHSISPVALIMALVVAPDGRGRGIGRALVRAAEAWAVEQGCERLMVTSAEHRSDAHAFYPACGMPYTGRRFATMLPRPGG